MNRSDKSWQFQTLAFGDEMKDALQQQHHAAQYLALVGRHLIPQQADDSNTNMEFVPEAEMIVGNRLSNGMKVGLQLNNLQLKILDEANRSLKTISLIGKTKKQGFNELKKNFSYLGVDTSSFTDELHYETPGNALDKGAVFTVKDEKYFLENTYYRHNARLVLNELVADMDYASEVKIWPHHFDTGSFISYAKNESGSVSQTIGLGLAISDGMVDEPYYYLSFWSENVKSAPAGFKTLKSGKWMMPDWNGAILPLSEFLKKDSANEQLALALAFFRQAMEQVFFYLQNQ